MEEKATDSYCERSQKFCSKIDGSKTELEKSFLKNGLMRLKNDEKNVCSKSSTKRKWTHEELNAIEDKELRKKLRNRQSAMAARERKKAKMEQLESKVSYMFLFRKYHYVFVTEKCSKRHFCS